MHGAVTRTLVLLGASTVLLPAGCTSTSGPDRIPKVQLEVETATLAVGDTLQARLLPMLPPGYVPPVEWSSSNPTIAGVLATGTLTARVTGLQAGQAVIHVAGEGARDSLRVTVVPGGP